MASRPIAIQFHRAGGASRSTALAKAPSHSRQRFMAVKAKAAEGLKRASARTRMIAAAQKHRLVSVGAAVGLGLLRRFAPETMAKLSFGPVNPELVVGLGALMASYFVKSDILDHLATVGLAIGAYQFAATIGTEGDPSSYGGSQAYGSV